MTKKYQTNDSGASAELNIPPQVSVVMDQIAEDAGEGLLAVVVSTGLQVMHALMDEDVTAACGPKGRHNPARGAIRHGTQLGSVALGGRRLPVARPRVRASDGSGEVPLASYDLFTSTDLLGQMAMERMLAGVSTRRYRVALEPVGSKVDSVATSTSKSAVSRRFVAMTKTALDDLMTQDLSELNLVGLMIDGGNFAEHLCVVAMGIDLDGKKHPLALVEGSTENTTLVKRLLVGLRERGLDTTRPTLMVLDGAKALHAAVKEVFDHPVIQRCQEHKLRNVKEHLPVRMRAPVLRRMKAAYRADSALDGLAQLEALAKELDKTHPGAAGSLREGMSETFTVQELGVAPTLARTLRSTNPIESMISICRTHSRNVKRWRNGDMAMRWCAAGMIEASTQFRRVRGHLHLTQLRASLESHVAAATQVQDGHTTHQSAA